VVCQQHTQCEAVKKTSSLLILQSNESFIGIMIKAAMSDKMEDVAMPFSHYSLQSCHVWPSAM